MVYILDIIDGVFLSLWYFVEFVFFFVKTFVRAVIFYLKLES